MRKSKIRIILLICLFPILLQADLNVGLIAHYPFNGNANDESGNEHHGVVTGATLGANRFGNDNSAYVFDNDPNLGVPAEDFITITDDPALRLTDSLSFSFWINPESVMGRHIIAKQLGDGEHDSFVIWFELGTALKFNLENIYGSYTQIYSTIPTLNEWHHIVASWNGSVMKLYVDRNENDSGIFTGPIDYDSNSIFIGADDNNADDQADEGWDGILDDFRIYDRALTEDEIDQLYSLGSWMSNPENISITITNENVILNWNPVAGATSYKVYSSDNPSTGFIEDTTGTFNNESWNSPAPDEKRFYYVTAMK